MYSLGWALWIVGTYLDNQKQHRIDHRIVRVVSACVKVLYGETYSTRPLTAGELFDLVNHGWRWTPPKEVE